MRLVAIALLFMIPAVLFGEAPASGKPSPFPAFGTGSIVVGELVQADFIHRTGQFRNASGELIDFKLPSYGAIRYLAAEADLRDLPLGTQFEFLLHGNPVDEGKPATLMRDRFTQNFEEGIHWRVEEIQDRKIIATTLGNLSNQGNSARQVFRVPEQARIWKKEQPALFADLASGDELWVNIAGAQANGEQTCAEIWVGESTQRWATQQQREKHHAFVKFRGLPGRVEQTAGNKLVVTFFSGDPKSFAANWLNDFGKGKELKVVVANDELRTWNPPVDNEHGQLLEIQSATPAGYGDSGITLAFTVGNMLEGLRRGRVVRVFGAGWQLNDQFYGESLMGYGYGRLLTAEIMEITPKEYPSQFPFRTDYGNQQLPWHQLQPDLLPPRFSEHVVCGELSEVNSEQRTGKFRPDRSGATIAFALIPAGKVQYLHSEASLTDLPLGTRCRFHLYQDAQGAFTRASQISDEFSYLASNAITYRIESLRLDQGKLHVARQIPEVKNYNGDMEQPPDIGRSELLVNSATRVWKGEQQIQLADLAIGDALLVNLTGEQREHPARCTDLWVGFDTHKQVAEMQSKRHKVEQK